MTSTESTNWLSIVEAIHLHRMQGKMPASNDEDNVAIGDWAPVMSSDQAAVYYSSEYSAFAKIFYETRLKHKLKNCLLPSTSRHKRFVDRTNNLHYLNIPAPKIIASGMVEKNGYVVSEAFPGMGLGSFFARYLSPTSNNKNIYQWRRKAVNSLGHLVAGLHNAKISHGDLRPNNILLSCISREPDFCFIDNERNSNAKSSLTEEAMIKNLVQLNMIWLEDVCLTDRFRFINSYFQALEKIVYPSFGDVSYQRRIIKIIQKKTMGRLVGKSKNGYREVFGFEPFVPDLTRFSPE